MKMAEELLPRLRVADWLDRAEAAQRQLEHLDLRDLRSVVAASDDPLVARDESTRELAAALKAALVTKQEEELALWLADVEAALDVGRVVRALRLSSVPPKAGVPFPGALATRLAEATTASLQPIDGPDRWAAVLEAAAFSPVRTLVAPTGAGRGEVRRPAGHRQAPRAAAPPGRRPVRRRGAAERAEPEAAAPDDRAATPPRSDRRRSRPPAPSASRARAASRPPRSPPTRRPPTPRRRRSTRSPSPSRSRPTTPTPGRGAGTPRSRRRPPRSTASRRPRRGRRAAADEVAADAAPPSRRPSRAHRRPPTSAERTASPTEPRAEAEAPADPMPPSRSPSAERRRPPPTGRRRRTSRRRRSRRRPTSTRPSSPPSRTRRPRSRPPPTPRRPTTPSPDHRERVPHRVSTRGRPAPGTLGCTRHSDAEAA